MLKYKILGSGRPVLFIHGFLESNSMWDVLKLDEFPLQSILIDLPGHGKSDFDFKINTIKEIATYLYEFLKSKNFESYDIVGHSLGGYVAIELHKLLKQKKKLILLHSTFLDDSEEKKANRNRVIEVVRKNKNLFLNEAIPNLFLEEYRNSSFVKQLVSEAQNITTETIIRYSEMMRDRYSNTPYVLEKNSQVILFQGEFDHIIDIKNHRAYFNLIKTEIVSNAGHMGHFEQTDSVKNLLKLNLCQP